MRRAAKADSAMCASWREAYTITDGGSPASSDVRHAGHPRGGSPRTPRFDNAPLSGEVDDVDRMTRMQQQARRSKRVRGFVHASLVKISQQRRAQCFGTSRQRSLLHASGKDGFCRPPDETATHWGSDIGFRSRLAVPGKRLS